MKLGINYLNWLLSSPYNCEFHDEMTTPSLVQNDSIYIAEECNQKIEYEESEDLYCNGINFH